MSGFSNPIIGGGGGLVYPAIKSPNFVSGSAGWKIGKDGSAEFNDVTIRGMILAATIIGALIENSSTDPKTSINADGTITITNSSGDVIWKVAADGTMTWSSASGAQLMQLSPSGVLSITDPAALEFPSGASFEQNVAAIAAGVGGSSPAQFIQLLLQSASTTTAGAHDQVLAEFNSAADNNSSDANLELIYKGSNGTLHEYASMDSTGFNILAGLITAMHPGSSPATPETRQSAAAGNGWSGTVFYELVGTNRVEIVAQLTAPAAAVNGVTIVTLASGYRPTTSGIQFAVGSSAVNTAGDSPTMTLGTDGTLKSTNVFASSTVWIGPIQIPLDL